MSFYFKLIDPLTSQTKYLFKLLQIEGFSPDSFYFTYTPYSRYSSVLILDYFLGKKDECGVVLKKLTDMIKSDLEASREDFIILGGSEPCRAKLNKPLKYGKGQGREGKYYEDLEWGFRIYDDNDLQVVRDISLSRNIISNLNNLNPDKLALRVDDGKLVIDYIIDSSRIDYNYFDINELSYLSKRNIESSLDFKHIVTSQRLNVRGSNIVDTLSNYKRKSNFKLYSINDYLLTNRYNKSKTCIERSDFIGLRDILTNILVNQLHYKGSLIKSRDLYVNESIFEFIRDKYANVHIEHALYQLDRIIDESLFISTLGESILNNQRIITKLPEMVLGRLKAREYSTFIHWDLIKSSRDVVNTLNLEQIKKLNRLASSSFSLLFSGTFFREATEKLYIDYGFLGSERDFKNKLELFSSIESAYRYYSKQGYIDAGFKDGLRYLFCDVLIHPQLFSYNREMTCNPLFILNQHMDMKRLPVGYLDIQDTVISERVNKEQLNVLNEYMNGNRVSEVEVFIEDYFKLAKRGNKQLYLLKDSSAERLADNELILAKSILYDKDILKPTLLTYSQLGYKDILRPTLLTYSPLGYRGNDSRLSVLKSLLSQRHSSYDLYLGYNFGLHRLYSWEGFLEKDIPFIISGGSTDVNYIWEGILMDDIFFGDLVKQQVYLSYLYGLGNRETLDSGLVNGLIYAGVRERIDALKEAGIIQSSRGENGGIILTFIKEATSEAGKSVLNDSNVAIKDTRKQGNISESGSGEQFRPAQIVADDPLGYINASPADFMGGGELGRKGVGSGKIEKSSKTASNIERESVKNGGAISSSPKKYREGIPYDGLFGSNYKEAHLSLGLSGSPEDYRKSLLSKEQLLSMIEKFRGGYLLDSSLEGGYENRGGYILDDSKLGMSEDIKCIKLDGNLFGGNIKHGIKGKGVLGGNIRHGIKIDNEIFGYYEEKNAKVGVTLIGELPTRDTIFQGFLIAGKDDKHSLPFEINKYIADKYGKNSIPFEVNNYLAGKEAKNSLIKEEKSFEKNTKDFLIEKEKSLEKNIKDTLINESQILDKNQKGSYIEDQIIGGNENEKIAQLATGFIFGESEIERFECLRQLYLATKSKNLRLGELLEEYAGYNEKKGSILDDDVGKQIKEAFSQEVELLGQGLIYDYTKDIIDADEDLKEWETGFGIPEDYNPKDPFNKYYPWTKDFNSLELVQLEDWKEFGNGSWELDKNKGEFYSNNDQELSGLFRDSFDQDSYKFSLEFVVEGSGDKGVGVVIKYYSKDNYYMFMINGGDSSNSLGMYHPMQLYKVVNGVAKKFGSPMNPFKWERGKSHKIDVSVIEDRITIYVDGRLQYDFIEEE